MAGWLVGIDTGGTFTDLIAFREGSTDYRVVKVPSVPENPAAAVADALREFLDGGDGLDGNGGADGIAFLAHGTTVATNAVLEGKGARVGLLITEGFRAVYEARGWVRPDADVLIDTFFQKPPKLVPQHLTEEVRERVDFAGAVLTPLDEARLRKAVRRLKAREIDGVAICFLFSFMHPGHEERAAEIVREEAPGLRVSPSSRVLPVIREYPRLSTTVLDAYVGPIIEGYVGRLAGALDAQGVATPQKYLMQSNGGLMPLMAGARYPNQTLFSGPAAGVVAGLEVGRLCGVPDVVTFDMGGTSADISVITGGALRETSEGQIAGQDVATPMLAVRTIGAGGGTIARVGKDGLLKVGPESAGADPGPACYGRGGVEPTVTDANLILGCVGASGFLAGRMALQEERAREAVRRVADPLGLSVLEAAAGIIRIVDNNMAVELRLALLQQGHDPRKSALVAFGGAGPLHAAALARGLNIPKVIVPRYPGITSAAGLLQTDVRHFYLRSAVGLLDDFPTGRMNELFAGLERRARADAAEEGFAAAQLMLKRQLDLRYPHQGYQLAIDCPAGRLAMRDKEGLKRDFDAEHSRIYGTSAENEEAEIVTFRVISEVAVPRLALPEIAAGRADPAPALIGAVELYDHDAGAYVAARAYDRERLRARNRIEGPARIEQYDATTVVHAGQAARVDRFGNLLIEARAAA